MRFDVPTLMVAGIMATATAGLLLLLAWNQLRDHPALAWWAAAQLTMSASLVALVAGLTIPSGPAVSAGSAISVLGSALVWAGLRRFDDRPVHWPLLALAPAAVLLAGPLAALTGHSPLFAGALTSFVLWTAFLLATTVWLWRGRGERLWARWPLIALFTIHTAIALGGIVDLSRGTFVAGAIPPAISWFGLTHFETILHAVGTAILMFALCKERRENAYRSAANIDALTGVANRGALMREAEARLEACRDAARPASLIVFDLDRFKAINDTFGHQTGDQVLKAFASTAQAAVRPNDFFGRLGGEEFAMFLPGATIETGRAIAERIRAGFACASHPLVAPHPAATVSAGVAAVPPDAGIDELLAAADGALYDAKNTGRNRVCLARPDLPPKTGPRLVRVA